MIETIEQLTAVEVGKPIYVEQNGTHVMWVRSENGFTREGVEVKPTMFVGALAAKVIAEDGKIPPKVGDYFLGESTRGIYCLKEQRGNTFHCDFIGKKGMEVTTKDRTIEKLMNPDHYKRVEPGDLPDWYKVAKHWHTYYMSEYKRRTEFEQQIYEIRNTVRSLERFKAEMEAARVQTRKLLGL
jgi:hypothetical protein